MKEILEQLGIEPVNSGVYADRWLPGEGPELASISPINGETIAMDGAQALAMGGNFYQLRDWSDDDWTKARDSIKAQNEKDRAARG